MQKTFQLIQVLDNLSHIPRTGGVIFSGIDPSFGDSIAEHSYKVVWLTLIFAKKISQSTPNLDQQKLLEIAITHDWSESILLDIPSGSPSYQSYFDTDIREVTKSAEKKAIEAIEKYVEEEIPLRLSNLNLSEKESVIIKSADISAILMEVLSWKYHGLKFDWFDYLWANTFKRLKEIIDSQLPELMGLLQEFETAYNQNSKPVNPFLTKPEFQNFKKLL